MEKCSKLVLAFVLFIAVAYANFDVDTPLVHASSLKKMSMNDFPACFPDSQCCYDGSKKCPEDQECLVCTKRIPAKCFCTPKRNVSMEFVHASNMGNELKCREDSQCCPGSKPCPKGQKCGRCDRSMRPRCICTPERNQMHKSVLASMEFVHASNMGNDLKCKEDSQCCPGSKPCPKGKECAICDRSMRPMCFCTPERNQMHKSVLASMEFVHASNMGNDLKCKEDSQCCPGSKPCPKGKECAICDLSMPPRCICTPRENQMHKSLPASMEFAHASNMVDDVICQERSECCPGSKPCSGGKECLICAKTWPPICFCTDPPSRRIATVV